MENKQASSLEKISTHAPAGGATGMGRPVRQKVLISTHAPAGGATTSTPIPYGYPPHFYSRPCGRGDTEIGAATLDQILFLLTPLREGRPGSAAETAAITINFYSRPCGRGDLYGKVGVKSSHVFLLTPLREGRRTAPFRKMRGMPYFYSRPCGRGDKKAWNASKNLIISTHAPAGGAT